MTNVNELHKTLSTGYQYALSVLIFVLALLLRFAIAPVDAGVAYLTFYPSVLISFYFCGTRPGILNAVLSAFAGYYVFTAPFWVIEYELHAYLPTFVFFISVWLAGYIVTMLHRYQDQLNQSLTERTQQLDETNKLLVMAERSAGAGAWYWDITRDKRFWDTQLIALFGLDPSTVAPTHEDWQRILHPDDYPSAHQAIKNALSNKKPFVTSYRIIMPDKSIRWIDAYGTASFDATGRPLEMRGICINSTALREAEQLLRQNEQRFRYLFDNLPVAYQSLDIEGRWLDANQKMADLLGFENPQQMTGLNFVDFWDEEIKQHFNPAYDEFKKTHSVEGELKLVTKNRKPVTVIVRGHIQRDAQGNFLRTHCILTNITERREMEEAIIKLNTELEQKVEARTSELQLANQALENANKALENLARVDALTQLPNRLAANERLHDEFVRMKRTKIPYVILMLDIDFFKHVNDTFGHAVGDTVLQKVADTIKQAIRTSDFAARFGGEEFLVLLPQSDFDAGHKVAEKIRQAVQSLEHVQAGKITVSIGLALATEKQNNEDEAVNEADNWLYVAKDAGRNQVQPNYTKLSSDLNRSDDSLVATNDHSQAS